MCGVCGCSDGNARIDGKPHHHHGAHEIDLEIDIMAKNDAYAAVNRQRFAKGGLLALNLVSAPGSGKTSLLVKTIEMLTGRLPVSVIEGDQQTSRDAETNG